MAMLDKENEIITLSEVGDAVLMSNDTDTDTGRLQIFAGGRKYQTTFTKKFLERKTWKAPDPNEIKSHIPGEVSEILVKENEKVNKGTKLMIYDAMKMKNIITAPFDAKVVKISVCKGDKLPKGALLMVLSPYKK